MAFLSRIVLILVCMCRAQDSDESAQSFSDPTCGGSAFDAVSALQLRHSSQKTASPDYAVCPGSQTGPGLEYRREDRGDLYKEAHCTAEQCCEGNAATNNHSFPCPLAGPGLKCQTTAPEEIVYTLVVGTCALQLPGEKPVITRCYNGSIPGPTLFIKAGMVVTIHVHNTLTQPNPPPFLVNITSNFNESFKDQTMYGKKVQEDNELVNTYISAGTGSAYGHINSTNLHVHGIVVPGHQPADDVLITIMPNHSYTYTFNIPTYHMPGTHWYHPHRHHATGAQVNGGMFGALIVNDTHNSIPPEYADAEEYILRMDTLYVRLEERLARLSKDKLWNIRPSNKELNITLVNGEVKPAFSIKSGRWYRFRMIYAAEFRVLRPLLDTDTFEGSCQMKLIAKDGVYLNKAPRPVSAMWFASGNTADVMISCSCTKATSCSATMISTWNGTKVQPGTKDRTFDGELFSLDISDDKSSPPVLPKFEVKRPCYLVDLTKASVLDENKHAVELAFREIKHGHEVTFTDDNAKMYEIPGEDITEDNKAYFGVGWDGTRLDRFIHDDQAPLATIPMDQVQDWNVTNVGFHPLHIHVQPFQIQELGPKHGYRIEADTENEDWDQLGDWHDVFMSAAESGWVTIRFALRLRGIDKLVLHCHFLNHEDQGLMAFFNVTDSKCEGEQCAEAIAKQTDDGTCFMNYFTLDGPAYKLG